MPTLSDKDLETLRKAKSIFSKKGYDVILEKKKKRKSKGRK